MFTRISRNGGSSLFFKSFLLYSTTAAELAQPQHFLLADYLTKSLGFTNQEAISASIKVRRSKPIKKDPSLVVNFLKNLGLNKTHVKSLVSAYPELLLSSVDKTLKPKVRFFQDLGLSGSDLAKLLVGYRQILIRGLDNHIKPRIQFLRQLLGTDENVAAALKKYALLLGYYESDIVTENVMLLRNCGFSDKKIAKFIIRNPRRIFMTKSGWIQERLDRVENELGIPRESPMFYYGAEILCNFNKSTIDLKLGVLRSFGWSDDDIRKMLRTFPIVLSLSEARMRKVLEFLMKELGYSADYLASHPAFFSLSLEKRVKLRNEVLKVLNEKKLNKKKAGLYKVVCLAEPKFVEDYLLPYKDKIPDVYKSYIEGVAR